MNLPEVEAEAIVPVSSKRGEIIVKPDFQTLTFNCQQCGYLLAIGYKSIWEADPDRTGDVGFRCLNCKRINPMGLTYQSAHSTDIFVPIIAARFIKNRRKIHFSEIVKQVNGERKNIE